MFKFKNYKSWDWEIPNLGFEITQPVQFWTKDQKAKIVDMINRHALELVRKPMSRFLVKVKDENQNVKNPI